MTVTFERRIGDTERKTQNRVVDLLLKEDMGLVFGKIEKVILT